MKSELVDVPTDNYHQQLENYASEMLPVPPPPKTQVYQPPPAYQNQNPPYQNQGYQNQNTSYQNQNTSYQNSYQPPVQYDHRPKYEEYTQPKYDEYQQNQFAYGQYQQPAANYGVGSQQKIGRIQDYDPLSDGPRSAPNTQRASATLIYNSTSDGKRGAHQQAAQTRGEKAAYASPEQNYMQVVIPKHSADVKQKVYVAMYDYEANDSDEVSFREGDFICNVTAIDEGWMTGQVLRTGRTGMLPANYVDLAPAGTYTH
ncbi:LIM and SH3 domain protein Lasp-like [Choristoneura fumiferana]|uniref:LIM and SH3 domain protein Lasp-like n=1 Tax=Choristoneura fumiferana TaxID=7141 RepID=UPI003D157330